jgi:diguanylate cyclase (GGDEF)-like protein
LRAVVRESDTLARMGGDEFALILPDTGDEASRVVADKLIQAVRANGSVLSDGRRTVVTASIGITALNGRRGVDAAQLLREADAAMYEAKAAGKDAVVVHGSRGARDAVA